jgi:hypothetical protein
MPDSGNYIFPEEHTPILLDRECKRAERYEHFFSVLLIKFDKGGSYESRRDTLASLMEGVIRNSDIIGALQGNKLAVILHHAELTKDIAERIRTRMKDRIPQFKIVGAACYPTDATTVEGLLNRAQSRGQ